MDRTFDVLGLGCVAIDDLLYVASYPAADTKMQVRRRERHCGGLTATALVAAARLGSDAAFAGVLGDDELSQFVVHRFREEGIDTQHVRRRAEARPIHSVIVVDESTKTRTILYSLEGAFGAEPDWPGEKQIRSSRVLFVDHFGIEGMSRAARIARDAGIPVVADLESNEHPRFSQLLDLVDHPIVSQDFAIKLTGEREPAVAVLRLWSPSRKAAVVTCGDQGCWYVGSDAPAAVRHQPAFAVEVVDTTGCGDVFHGAYASALARGLDLPSRVRFASAAAALKATQRGGQAGFPDRGRVEDFLANQPRSQPPS
jgi:sugar/nucleoside kinase (ribokinase family)